MTRARKKSMVDDGPFESRVTLTIAIPAETYSENLDGWETLIRALRGQGKMPKGSSVVGNVTVRYLTQTEIKRAATRAAQKRAIGGDKPIGAPSPTRDATP